MINIHYAQMRTLDISNGEGVGVSLFVQGCPFHCKNCFNKETWNPNDGDEWTDKDRQLFFSLINRPFIKRVSFLGGEPLFINNLKEIEYLCETIKHNYPEKVVWLYSGYVFENIFNSNTTDMIKRQSIIRNVDIMVDGQFIEEQKDMNLYFRGSKNQRLIDVQKSIKENRVVLWGL